MKNSINKIITKLGLLVITLGLIGCQNDQAEKEKNLPSFKLSETISKEIVESNNAFALELLQTIYENDIEDENIFISPLSMSMALAMINNGATGQTKKELTEVLRFKNISEEDMNSYFGNMIYNVSKANPLVSFESANSIWIDENFPVLNSFKEKNMTYYNANIQHVDFSNLFVLAKQINTWANDKTHGMIPSFVSENDLSGQILFLANAICFEGKWTHPFPKKDTKEEVFYNQNGNEIKLPTMNLAAFLIGTEGDGYSSVELPYGDESFLMEILLPDENEKISSIIAKLNIHSSKQAEFKNTFIKLPRFNLNYSRHFNRDMEIMGATSLFSSNTADFSGLSHSPLHISHIMQKAVIEVDEEGTKAAATTGVGATSPNPDDETEPRLFYVDKPFIFLIKENNTGVICFIGIIRNL
jgi:serpin B